MLGLWHSCMPVSEHQRLSRHLLVVTLISIFYWPLLLRGVCSAAVWYAQSPLWIADSGPQGQERFEYPVGLGQCTFCNGCQIWITRLHTSLGDSVHQVVDLFLEKNYTLLAWVLGYTPWTNWRPHAVCGDVPPPSARKWLRHLSRWGNKWGLTCWDIFASVSEMWVVHCTAQRACGHIQKTPNCLPWMWYFALMLPPFLFAKTPIWSLGMKNFQHLPDSPTPPEFLAGGRSPFFICTFRQQ